MGIFLESSLIKPGCAALCTRRFPKVFDSSLVNCNRGGATFFASFVNRTRVYTSRGPRSNEPLSHCCGGFYVARGRTRWRIVSRWLHFLNGRINARDRRIKSPGAVINVRKRESTNDNSRSSGSNRARRRLFTNILFPARYQAETRRQI